MSNEHLFLTVQERQTSPYTYMSEHRPRQMTAETAAQLYQKLKSHLGVAKSWGNYLPIRFSERHTKRDWPLGYREKVYTEQGAIQIVSPTPICWDPSLPNPTFQQFLHAYNITIQDQ